MTGVCHHCGEPLPQSPVRADVEGTTRDFCCEGCAAAARWILDAHLDDYYRLRSAPGGRVDADAPALAAWDREELLAGHAREVDGGREPVGPAADHDRCAHARTSRSSPSRCALLRSIVHCTSNGIGPFGSQGCSATASVTL